MYNIAKIKKEYQCRAMTSDISLHCSNAAHEHIPRNTTRFGTIKVQLISGFVKEPIKDFARCVELS